MAPYIRRYWWQAIIAVGITIPVGALDAVIAWALKPYMDVMMYPPAIKAAITDKTKGPNLFKPGLR